MRQSLGPVSVNGVPLYGVQDSSVKIHFERQRAERRRSAIFSGALVLAAASIVAIVWAGTMMALGWREALQSNAAAPVAEPKCEPLPPKPASTAPELPDLIASTPAAPAIAERREVSERIASKPALVLCPGISQTAWDEYEWILEDGKIEIRDNPRKNGRPALEQVEYLEPRVRIALRDASESAQEEFRAFLESCFIAELRAERLPMQGAGACGLATLQLHKSFRGSRTRWWLSLEVEEPIETDRDGKGSASRAVYWQAWRDGQESPEQLRTHVMVLVKSLSKTWKNRHSAIR